MAASIHSLGRSTHVVRSRSKPQAAGEFLQYLAASPLLAAGGASAFAETLLPKAKLPDPLMWGPLDPSA